MKFYEIPQTVTMSLLTKLRDNDPESGKSVYEKTSTVRFKYSEDIFPIDVREELFQKLVIQMSKELLENDKAKATSIGLWVDIEDKKFENAIDLQVLSDMKKYGEKDVEPILEFYKMTIDDYANK